jgi:hypothetical protein
MALVHKLQSAMAERNSVHAEVECLYKSFTDANGDRYFQLDTYGSPNRQESDRPSQSIQFDSEAAAQLVKIIKAAFGPTAASW